MYYSTLDLYFINCVSVCLFTLVMCLFTGATTDNLPPGVLYRVKATYKYNREDEDELSFEVGEVIRVVEYDDPEEQVNIWFFLIFI